MTQAKGFKGLVGYSLRELTSNESSFYCSNSNQEPFSLLLNRKNYNFTFDFMIRSYTSGCYYYNTNTGKWSSFGMELYEDTNLEFTHCLSNHLTSFAGGLVLTPSSINYKYVFANSYFICSPTIYITIIFAISLYVLFAIYSILMEQRDSKKMLIYAMKDNYPNDSYFYEIIVFTGNRSESGTQSIVNIFFLNKRRLLFTFFNYL